MSERWFRVCPRSELKSGQAKSITTLGRPYAVFDVGGELYGLDSACKHMRANLANGKIVGHTVECFMHKWRYDIKSGQCLTNEGFDTTSRPVKIVEDVVWIAVEWPENEF